MGPDQSLELVEAIIESIWHGIMVINNRREIIKINESLANLFYLDRSQVLGKKTINVFNNNRLENLISAAFGQGSSQKEQIVFYGDEELYLDMEAISINLEEKPGDRQQGYQNKKMPTHMILLANNNTQEIEFSKLRSQFVANVSHEMRTPLTSVRGYLETLAEDDLSDTERVKSYMVKSLKEVERLNFLIEDVLNLSRIEYKRNVLLKEEVNIEEIIKDTIASLDYLARQNSTDIHFNYKGSPVKFFTDEHLFRQLVKNLVENSIFHSGKNSQLNISLKQDEKGINMEFTDNGAGISKSDLPFIFQRFYRGKSQFGARRISSGLGLSIVKHIVELHNGRIKVESIPDTETSFKIFLPARPG
ncbi:MAG: ATP-binding protein [Actinomycetota bacterium]|nr:ATP-binding protein [Actinomycetota bacterium]